MFILRDDVYQVVITGNLVLGDLLILVAADGIYLTETILDIVVLDGSSTVYQFSCEPYHWFIAGGYLGHNK
jgi:hypothetical protein